MDDIGCIQDVIVSAAVDARCASTAESKDPYPKQY